MPRAKIEVTERDVAPVSIFFRVLTTIIAIAAIVHRCVNGPHEERSDISMAVGTSMFLLVAIFFNPRVALVAVKACTVRYRLPGEDDDVETKEETIDNGEATTSVENVEVS